MIMSQQLEKLSLWRKGLWMMPYKTAATQAALEFPGTQSVGLTKTVDPVWLGLIILQWILPFRTPRQASPLMTKHLNAFTPAFRTQPLPLPPAASLFWYQSRAPLAISFSSLLELRYSLKHHGRMLEAWMTGKLLSSRSSILEVGCQGSCAIWSFRDWMKETLG